MGKYSFHFSTVINYLNFTEVGVASVHVSPSDMVCIVS